MDVTCRCPECQTLYRVAEKSLGRSARCKRCGHSFVLVRAAQDAAGSVIEIESAPPPKSQSEHQTPAGDTTGEAPAAPAPGTTRSWHGGEGAAGVPATLGRFQIRKRLGAGGFGTVYRAHDPLLGRDVALKVPHPSRFQTDRDKARILREAKAAAQLRHPNIVPVYDAGMEREQFFIATAFIEGQSLAGAIQSRRVDLHQAAKIVSEIAGALRAERGQSLDVSVLRTARFQPANAPCLAISTRRTA